MRGPALGDCWGAEVKSYESVHAKHGSGFGRSFRQIQASPEDPLRKIATLRPDTCRVQSQTSSTTTVTRLGT